MGKTARVVALLIALNSASQSADWKQVETFRFNWNGHDGVLVVLEIPKARTDPGDFTRIRVRVPGHKEFTLVNENGWVRYNSPEASTSRQIRNQVSQPSKYVLALTASRRRTVLFLFGYSYASAPGSLDVLEISASGEPRVVFHRDEFGLEDFRDLDHDGVAEIIGRPCLSEAFGDGLLTYDPFNVLKLSAVAGTRANLSLPLSKGYNLRHYYGWAGAECSENISVVLHPPKGGRPALMKTTDAEKFMSGKQSPR